jgi:hypothetical protein
MLEAATRCDRQGRQQRRSRQEDREIPWRGLGVLDVLAVDPDQEKLSIAAFSVLLGRRAAKVF